MKKNKKQEQQRVEPIKKASPSLPKQKTRIFYAILVLIPILFFILLEIGLRLGNYGNDIPLFVTFEENADYYKINPDLGQRYFPSSGVKPLASQTDFFLKQKPAQSFRIFVLGGSSAAGYPYLYNGNIGSILRNILNAHYPENHIEVISMAMPAVSSYTVRDVALELGDYDPDLLLVYAGHNEFYGGLGLGSTENVGNSIWLVHLYLGLRPYKTFQLLRNGIAYLKQKLQSTGDRQEKPGGTLMARMVKDRHISYGSHLFHKAADVFETNMSGVANFCRERKIPLLIGSLVSNIRDHRPFVDVFEDGTPKGDWKNTFYTAETLFQQQKYQQALETLQQCIHLDSLPASQYFLMGEIYEALADSANAYTAFYKAKEFDGLRFRASENVNERIQQLSKIEGVRYVPTREAFEANSPGKIPGKTLLLEHLHPNLNGYALIAKKYAEAIVDANYIGTPANNAVPDSLWMSQIGVTDVDIEAANIRIQYLMMGWPFTDAPTIPKAEFKIKNATPLQRLALQFWQDEITWEKMHVDAAQYYTQTKQFAKAEKEFRALIHATPMNISPYLFLGRLLYQQKKMNEALAVFLKAIEIEENTFAYKVIGSIYLTRKDPAGVQYLEKAAQADANDLETLYLLAQGYVIAESFNKADATIKKLLHRKADYRGAQQLAAYITQAKSRQVGNRQ